MNLILNTAYNLSLYKTPLLYFPQNNYNTHRVKVTSLVSNITFFNNSSATMVGMDEKQCLPNIPHCFKQFLNTHAIKSQDCLKTVFINNVSRSRNNLISYIIKTQNKTGNVHINIILRYIHVIIIDMEKQ
jgi:hypothetical protein